jgi:hypothetical protein
MGDGRAREAEGDGGEAGEDGEAAREEDAGEEVSYFGLSRRAT